MAIQDKFYLGIDLGGTKILAAVVDQDGNPLGESTMVTPADKNAEEIADSILAASMDVIQITGVGFSSIAGTGIATAGGIDFSDGLVVESPNLKSLNGLSLVNLLKAKLPMPLSIINDADAAVLAEYRLGSGIGAINLIYITISTGIGGGLVLNGELYRGSNGLAAEIGHMTIISGGPDCSCGRQGCLEALSSGTALAREARAQLKRGEPSLLQKYSSENGVQSITAELIFLAESKGDKLSRYLIQQAASHLGTGLKNLVNIFAPDRIVIGGGLSNQWPTYVAPAVKVMREDAFADLGRHLRVLPSHLGQKSGAIGAAIIAASGV